MSEDTPDLPRYHWNVKPVQTPSTDTPPGVSGIVLSILGGRGITGAERISEFLSPVLSRLNSPFMFADMERAAARVADAVLGKENVCIYGDYDADGMTSTALLKLYLNGLGLEARTFIPDRETDGYGLHTSRIDEIGATGVTLIVCVDCGIKSTEAALHAAASGIDLVILDHHLPG
ncbi:MAG TPA: DHH family phosphoesterase, partial [Myxococcota bacterium]|nr:DHH family phosphoesterase [Myxococcota bacterium]